MTHAFDITVAVQAMYDAEGVLLGMTAADPTAGLHSEAEEDVWSVADEQWVDVTAAFPERGESVAIDARAEVAWALARGQHPSVVWPPEFEMPDLADLKEGLRRYFEDDQGYNCTPTPASVYDSYEWVQAAELVSYVAFPGSVDAPSITVYQLADSSGIFDGCVVVADVHGTRYVSHSVEPHHGPDRAEDNWSTITWAEILEWVIREANGALPKRPVPQQTMQTPDGGDLAYRRLLAALEDA